MSEIKQVKVADLVPYVNNARTHSDKQAMDATSITASVQH